MADCPVCGSRLYVQRSFPNLFNKKFGCDACGWKMPVGEVHERGGLDRISLDIASGKNRGEKREWEQIDRLPGWAFRKMKRRRTNHVSGENYRYKKEGNSFYRKKK